MTPIARQKVDVRDAMKFMSHSQIEDAADDLTLPLWARKMYAAESERRYAEIETANKGARYFDYAE